MASRALASASSSSRNPIREKRQIASEEMTCLSINQRQGWRITALVDVMASARRGIKAKAGDSSKRQSGRIEGVSRARWPLDWGMYRMFVRKHDARDLRLLVVCSKDLVELSGESWRGNPDRVR